MIDYLPQRAFSQTIPKVSDSKEREDTQCELLSNSLVRLGAYASSESTGLLSMFLCAKTLTDFFNILRMERLEASLTTRYFGLG
jgi:hypothetical protein